MADHVLICATRGYFADDVATTCQDCGAAIVHRPHAPPGYRKICAGCGATRLRADPNARIDVTGETAREVDLFFRKAVTRA